MIRRGDITALALEGGWEGQLHGSEADVFHALWGTYHRCRTPAAACVGRDECRERGGDKSKSSPVDVVKYGQLTYEKVNRSCVYKNGSLTD